MTRPRPAKPRLCGIRFQVDEGRQRWLYDDLAAIARGARSQRCVELMLMGKFFEEIATGRGNIPGQLRDALAAQALAAVAITSPAVDRHDGSYATEMIAGLPVK